MKFAEKKRYDKAIVELQKIVQEDPSDMRTLLKVGDFQIKMGAFPAAVETYERVAKTYAQQGFALKSIAVYKQVREIIAKHAPELDERYAHIVPRMAELFQQLGLKSDALAAFDEVATRLLKAGRDKDAVEVFRKIVGLDEHNPLAQLRLAEALARTKDVDGAIRCFETAFELLRQLGRRDDALKVVDRLLQIRPSVELAKRAATLYLERGQPSDGLLALAKLKAAFDTDKRDLDTLNLLARTFDQIGQREKAIAVWKELAKIAHEEGKHDIYQETVAYLHGVAPDDDGVVQMYQKLQPSVRPMHDSSSPESVSDSELSVEEIELEALESEAVELAVDSEAPFRLERQSRAPAAPHGFDDDRHSIGMVEVPELVEAAEDLQEVGAVDPDEYVAQAIGDSRQYRARRLFKQATDTLRVALEVLPGSIDLRVELRDVLLEVNDGEGAVGEMISIAAIATELHDVETAAANLRHALIVVPGHRRAEELLRELEASYGALPGAAEDDYASQAVEAQLDSFRQGQPLPSYDLEEVGAGGLLSTDAGMSLDMDDPFDAGAQPAAFGVDDPFAGGIPRVDVPPSLPSFHLDEDGLADAPPLDPSGALVGRAPSKVQDLRGFTGGDSIEDVLEEIDFFASRGMLEDARSALEDALLRAPNHPLLLDKRHELDEAAHAVEPGSSGIEFAPASALQGDIGDALDALDEAFEPVQEARPQISEADDQVDVEAVFAKFKEGVKAQVDDGDAATHYDLGVAYKEMGLVADAIGEFRMAARDPSRACVCLSMVGVIELEQGNTKAATAAFLEALAAGQRTVEQELALYYELGNIYEAEGQPKDALYYFRKIAAKDPTFRDVGERIVALGGAPAAPARAGDALGDDFDAVFDEVVGHGRVPAAAAPAAAAPRAIPRPPPVPRLKPR